MAVTAAIKFTQGVNVGPGGEALVGATGSLVQVENDDNTDVVNWTITLVSAPYDSVLGLGPLASGADGNPQASFTPDVEGSYLLQLDVDDGGAGVDKDQRVFAVPYGAGAWIIPAVSADPDLAASAHNFGGQLRGWGGTASPKQLDAILREIHDNLGGGASLPSGNANDVLIYDGANWIADLIADANVDPSAAIAGTKISPNFGAQPVVTTNGVSGGWLQTGGAVAAGGDIRLGPDADIRGLNSGETDDYNIASIVGDVLVLGDDTHGTENSYQSAGDHTFLRGSSTMFVIGDRLSRQIVEDTAGLGFEHGFKNGLYQDGDDPAIFILQKSQGNFGAPTGVADGNEIGVIGWSPYNGTDAAFDVTAVIRAEVVGVPGAGSVPTALEITVGATAGALVRMLRLVPAVSTGPDVMDLGRGSPNDYSVLYNSVSALTFNEGSGGSTNLAFCYEPSSWNTADAVAFIGGAFTPPNATDVNGAFIWADATTSELRSHRLRATEHLVAGTLAGIVATSGAIRLPNNVEIAWRNSTNSQNAAIYFDSSNILNVNAQSGQVRLSGSGGITLSNVVTCNSTLSCTAGGNTTTLSSTGLTFANNAFDYTISQASTSAIVGRTLNIQAQNHTAGGIGGNVVISSGTGGTTGFVRVNIGSVAAMQFSSSHGPLASSGSVRIGHGWQLTSRNNGNSADIGVLGIGVDAADVVSVGSAQAPTFVNASSGGVTIRTSGSARWTLNATSLSGTSTTTARITLTGSATDQLIGASATSGTPADLKIRAASQVTNPGDGADLLLQSGAGNGGGVGGAVRLQYNPDDTAPVDRIVVDDVGMAFFGVTPVARPQVTASGVTADDLLSALDSLGILESI